MQSNAPFRGAETGCNAPRTEAGEARCSVSGRKQGATIRRRRRAGARCSVSGPKPRPTATAVPPPQAGSSPVTPATTYRTPLNRRSHNRQRPQTASDGPDRPKPRRQQNRTATRQLHSPDHPAAAATVAPLTTAQPRPHNRRPAALHYPDRPAARTAQQHARRKKRADPSRIRSFRLRGRLRD